MSKRAFKKYLSQLPKEELEEQMLDLYERFNEVKTFYDFVFNPREEKLLKDAKYRISKEYFPDSNRKPKARRSVAQKFIKHFKKLGMDPHSLADVMFFNIEVAQTFAREREKTGEAFQKSIFKSYEEAVKFVLEKGISEDFVKRIHQTAAETENQSWENSYRFIKLSDRFL